jgi:phosphoglycerate kinase
MTTFKTLDDIEARRKTVLLRVDFNVPMQDGRVSDATRIERSLPTIVELADAGARVVIASHMGRPRGRPVDELSLAPVARELAPRTASVRKRKKRSPP